ncbi:transcriptional regulator, TetR family [Glycomyces harbinensis]|uniref:Transcriptional regulator, TetR family n=1 Tax=Glycomyces harbinensis TaxID=58114 RepID=A0A1G6T6D0_9ACTN|nr:transcriptional regulator, TetR family [Glycomyces harbinensis]
MGDGAVRSVRADARRNIEKLVQSAADVFRERGLNAPLEAIAQRAGVSTGTIYHRFGSREALIDAVVPDYAEDQLDEAAAGAEACADPWDGFALYVERVCELQASNLALNDVISRNHPGTAKLAEVCRRSQEQARRIAERAQADGALRADFAVEDLLFVFWSNAMLIRFTAETAPDAWRRSLAFTLDGLRTGAAHELPTAALTPAQVEQVMAGRGRAAI